MRGNLDLASRHFAHAAALAARCYGRDGDITLEIYRRMTLVRAV